MKIRIQDFGPIRDFTFDLNKDIHLLYGKNGTGKSYAVYCVYVILKEIFLSEDSFPSAINFLNKNEDSLKKTSMQLIERFAGGRKKSVKVGKEVERILERVFSTCSETVERPILSAYGSLENLNNKLSFGHFKFSIDTETTTICFAHQIDHIEVIKVELKKPLELVNDEDGFLSHFPGELLLGETLFADPELIVTEFCTEIVALIFEECNSYYTNLYFLPASRSGLYQGLNSFGPIIAELSKQRHLIRKKIELPTLSETVSDYYLALASIEKLELNQSLKKIVEGLEKNILNGEVIYSTDDQRITFRPNSTELNLDLMAASSMVAELSPIVTYLKYVVRVRSVSTNLSSSAPENEEDGHTILFIEEPEAHLHPEAQVKLMEVLAELPKHNIKVVMTSHSNYMFNKLTNLILEKKVDPDKVATYHMVMTDKGSVVQDDMPVTDEGIEDSNFITVAEQLYEERMQLLDEIEG